MEKSVKQRQAHVWLLLKDWRVSVVPRFHGTPCSYFYFVQGCDSGEHACGERLEQQALGPFACRMVRGPRQAPVRWELLLPGCHVRRRPSRTATSGLHEGHGHFSSYPARDQASCFLRVTLLYGLTCLSLLI